MTTPTQLFPKIILVISLAVSILQANGEHSERVTKLPDGTIETTKTTKYYDPTWERLLTILCYGTTIVLGSFTGYGGIRIILHSLHLGKRQAEAEMDLDIRKRKIKIKNVAQGSLVVLIGAATIIWAIYEMTQTQISPSLAPPPVSSDAHSPETNDFRSVLVASPK